MSKCSPEEIQMSDLKVCVSTYQTPLPIPSVAEAYDNKDKDNKLMVVVVDISGRDHQISLLLGP